MVAHPLPRIKVYRNHPLAQADDIFLPSLKKNIQIQKKRAGTSPAPT
jgi:hypothetical protein